MSYDITTNVGKVRLTIGDNTAAEVFTNAEIEFFLSINSNSIPLAAADALEAWMAKYATSASSEKIGDYAYTQDIVNKMNKLMKELRAKVASTPYLTWAEMELVDVPGGVETEMGE
ncbi:hypothetical protein ES703_60485 [subsurface metagenome]